MEDRGAINAYRCVKCRKHHLTVNLNAGTTPFMTDCPLCDGAAQSCFYRVRHLLRNETLTVSHAWYRPDIVKFAGLHLHTQSHVVMGGLLKGELRVAVNSAIADSVEADWELEQLIAFMRDTYAIDTEL